MIGVTGIHVGLANAQRVATPAFSPLDVGNAVLWLRGDLGAGAAQWDDQSGLGNHATQPDAGRRPTYRTGINGKATVFFDASVGGSEKFWRLPDAFTGLTAAHVFVVNKLSAYPAASGGFWRFGTGADVGGVHIPLGGGSAVYDDFGSDSRPKRGDWAAGTNANVYEVVSTAAEWTNKQDGVEIYTTATNTVAFVAGFPGIYLGHHPVSANYYDGDWAEIIIYDAKLSAPDRAQVIAYLNARYGLSAT